MSARNGDRARFHKDRARKLRRRQRIQQLMEAPRVQYGRPSGPPAPREGPTVTLDAALGE